MAERIVLCVDDEHLILLSLKHALRKELGAEFKIETADCGGAALDLIRLHEAAGREIAAVVSDWLMPGLNGDEFLRRVRAERPSICLILLSGFADKASVASLETEIGLAAVFQKPCRAESIAKTIRARV